MRNLAKLLVLFFAGVMLASCKKEMTSQVQPTKLSNQNLSPNLIFAGNRWDQLAVPPVGQGLPGTTVMYPSAFSANDMVYVFLIGYNQLWLYMPGPGTWSLVNNSFLHTRSKASR